MFHHYYHVYADGPHWREAVDEHAKALNAVTGEYRFVVGVVGAPLNRQIAQDHLESVFSTLPFEVHGFDSGWEQHTLGLLRADLDSGQIADPVLYTHTKGASDNSETNLVWRKCMEKNVVSAWESALELLEDGADVVGAHWLHPNHWPGMITSPFYGGNYWWSSVEHLKRLPPLQYNDRWDAEGWIGRVDPDRPVDTISGNQWPGLGCTAHNY